MRLQDEPPTVPPRLVANVRDVNRRIEEAARRASRDPAEVGRIRAALQRPDAPGATRIDAEGRVVPVPPEPRLVPPIRER